MFELWWSLFKHDIDIYCIDFLRGGGVLESPQGPFRHQIRCSYQIQWAEEEMNQLGRTRILYVPLQFGLQGAHRQTVRSWWAADLNEGPKGCRERRYGVFLTKRLRASLSFCRLSMNSASVGGLARRVSTPSVDEQSNGDHTQSHSDMTYGLTDIRVSMSCQTRDFILNFCCMMTARVKI